MSQELSLPRPPVTAVLEALSAKGTNERFDYERYETLGDAVLKLVASVDAFLEFPDATEGQLSQYKYDGSFPKLLVICDIRPRSMD